MVLREDLEDTLAETRLVSYHVLEQAAPRGGNYFQAQQRLAYAHLVGTYVKMLTPEERHESLAMFDARRKEAYSETQVKEEKPYGTDLQPGTDASATEQPDRAAGLDDFEERMMASALRSS